VEPEERVRADIREYGWHVVVVGASEGDEDRVWSSHPPAQAAYEALFAYTVGLRETFGHPEVILVGGWSGAHPFLNEVGELVRSGSRFAPGDMSHDVLEGFTVRFDAVGEACREACLTWASWAAGSERFSALQLVLPDRSGRWPEDAGYHGFPQPSLSS
jgi:hypothetical protein